jgi:hypothetical protein
MLARSWSGVSEGSDSVCEGAGILQTLRCADEQAWLEGKRLRGVGEEGEEEEGEYSGLDFSVGQKRKGGEGGKEEQQQVVAEEGEEEEGEEEEMGAFAPPYKVLRGVTYDHPSYPSSSSTSTSCELEEEDEVEGGEGGREDEPATKALDCVVTSPRDHQMMDILAAVVLQQQQQQV